MDRIICMFNYFDQNQEWIEEIKTVGVQFKNW